MHGGPLRDCARIAAALLDAPADALPLHGDLHHDNVLDFGLDFGQPGTGGGRGWLAIDPKGLLGARGFDYGNLFSNPQQPGEVRSEVALRPGVFERRLGIAAAASGLEAACLLRWIAAYSGLSAAWIIDDGEDPALPLAIAGKALAALGA